MGGQQYCGDMAAGSTLILMLCDLIPSDNIDIICCSVGTQMSGYQCLLVSPGTKYKHNHVMAAINNADDDDVGSGVLHDGGQDQKLMSSDVS